MNIEKLKAAAIASINHDGSNYYSHTYNHTKESNPATILELIERLEAAENQRDGLLAELRHCAEVFRQYEQLHILKCTDEGLEKAHRNGYLAARAEAAIASVKENGK